VTDFAQGTQAGLTVQWTEFTGGPPADVTGLTITITRVSDSTVMLGPTTVGITHPSVGLYGYTWWVPEDADLGDYAVVWNATDQQADAVQASEVITVIAATVATGLYVSLAQLKNYLGIPQDDTNDDEEMTSALASISREIEKCCHRQFNRSDVATSRVFYPNRCDLVKVDDFWTTTDLVIAIDQDGDGVYETTWTAADYQPEPLNGIVDGETGWPFWKIGAIGRGFPTRNRRPAVQVTARWGWAAVPAPIIQAAKIAAVETFSLKDTKFGVGNANEYGPIRVRQNPMCAAKWKPYVRDAILVG
jgi:hypothetical protein